MALVHLTDSNFKEEVLESDVPVLVDFYADWCGPCKMVAPVVEDLSREYAGKIKVGKVDVDKAPQTATAYGIMSIPTLVLFQGGKVAGQMVGVASRQELKKKIDAYLPR
jgi:thioredoxin 1